MSDLPLVEGFVVSPFLVQLRGARETNAPVLSSELVQARIEATFEGKFLEGAMIRLGDAMFFLPKKDFVRSIVQASAGSSKKWLEERFDCDDFAYVLKGAFSTTWYKMKEGGQCGLCCGIIWGTFAWLEGLHACNWFLDDSGKIMLIEPQSDQIYPASDCYSVDMIVV